MNRKQLLVIGALSVTAAFAGGIFGGWLFSPMPVQAQDLPSYAESISVENLLLVDKDGNLKGGLFINEGNPLLFLGDMDKQHVEAGAGLGNAAVRVTDNKGNVRTALGVLPVVQSPVETLEQRPHSPGCL